MEAFFSKSELGRQLAQSEHTGQLRSEATINRPLSTISLRTPATREYTLESPQPQQFFEQQGPSVLPPLQQYQGAQWAQEFEQQGPGGLPPLQQWTQQPQEIQGPSLSYAELMSLKAMRFNHNRLRTALIDYLHNSGSPLLGVVATGPLDRIDMDTQRLAADRYLRKLGIVSPRPVQTLDSLRSGPNGFVTDTGQLIPYPPNPVRDRLYQLEESPDYLTSMLAMDLLDIIQPPFTFNYRTMEKVLRYLEANGAEKTILWLEANNLELNIPFADPRDRAAIIDITDPEVKRFMMDGPFMDFIKQYNNSIERNIPMNLTPAEAKALQVIYMTDFPNRELASARTWADFKEYGTVSEMPSFYLVDAGVPIELMRLGYTDPTFAPYIEKYSHIPKEELRAIPYSVTSRMPLAEQAVISYYSGLSYGFHYPVSSTAFNYEVLKEYLQYPEVSAIAKRFLQGMPYFSGKLRWLHPLYEGALEETSIKYLSSLLYPTVSHYSDVLQSRSWLQRYQEFLQKPTETEAHHLLIKLKQIPRLILPSNFTLQPSGYPLLDERIQEIPKTVTTLPRSTL